MYDLSDLKPTTKEIAYCVLGVFIVLVIVFCAGYFCGIRTAAGTDAGSVHNHGAGIDAVREQLSIAESNQREITSGLESAVGRSESVEARSDRIEKAAGAATQSVTEAGRIIDECQQLIGQIRNRSQKGKAAY